MRQEFVLEVYVSFGRFHQKARKQEAISSSLQELLLGITCLWEDFTRRHVNKKL